MTQPTIGGLHEHDANSVIEEWLNEAGRGWQADAERTRTLAGNNDRPDIIIRQGDRMPVIVESEYGRPAVADAAARLNRTLAGDTRPFTEIVALGIAETCIGDTRAEFRRRLDRNERIFTIQLVNSDRGVWPRAPLAATPADLAAYCEYAQVPQAVIDRESELIAEKIASAGQRLHDSIRLTALRQRPTLDNLREIVGCHQDAEATRTACAIWLIAIDLQNDLANHSKALQNANLPTTQEMRAAAFGFLRQDTLLNAWRIIENANYLPVMELAINSLQAVTLRNTLPDVLVYLDDMCTEMNTLHAKHIYNFAGELWQRLVGDREERAAHYTKPEIAELLAALSAQSFQNLSSDQIAQLNLMDAACGTGTLIGAGERALRRIYAVNGGRNPELHRQRMQEHIIALDVNGIAGTLTAKRLTDMDVTQDYAQSKIAVVTHQAGSLSLLDPRITGITDYLGYGGVAATPGLNCELGLFHIAHGSIHWALMNPPYNRPRKGRRQATTGLEKLRPLAAQCGWKMSHGQAGLASDFGNMCNMRMAPQGVLAHVLPLTAAHAGSWKQWRAELEKDFQDIIAITNVSAVELQSMSADTGMSEMLVVATKRNRRPDQWQPTEILCVNLNAAPDTMAQGYAMAQEIAAIPADSQQGLLTNGNYTRMPQSEAGFPWSAIGNSNKELSAVSAALLDGKAYDPIMLTTHELAVPMAKLGEMADTGPTHDLIGYPKGGDGRGAFEWTTLDDLPVKPAQQSMWAADAKKQTSIATEATHGGVPVNQELARQMVIKRSRWHLNRNLALSSQGIAIAMTRNLTHGGRTWNALQDISDANAKCIALFYNSTPGVIVWRAYGQKGQRGPRAAIQVGAIPGLPCPAFHADTPQAQRAREIATEHFDELANLNLEPFAYCFRDANRHRIDSVVAEMLGLNTADAAINEMLAYYRRLFASEPNVNGRRKKIIDALEQYHNG